MRKVEDEGRKHLSLSKREVSEGEVEVKYESENNLSIRI